MGWICSPLPFCLEVGLPSMLCVLSLGECLDISGWVLGSGFISLCSVQRDLIVEKTCVGDRCI